VLEEEEAASRTEQDAALDAEVVAVLEAMTGESSEMAIGDIDHLVPMKESPPEQDATGSEPSPVQPEPAWRLFAAAWTTTESPKLAIVIDDLGLSEAATYTLAKMRGPYTLAYLPYAEGLPEQTELVRAAGHELMVHMPMQPHNKDADPGFNALLQGLGPKEFERRLEWNLSRVPAYVGINNHMGSALTEDAAAMVRVMVRLRHDGRLFLDSLTSPHSVGVRAAKATGVPYIARDIFLDNEREEGPILEQLEKAERIAEMRGYAVAIGHPYDITLETLAKWEKSRDRNRVVLVPISQLVARQEAVRHAAAVTPKGGARHE
jgi:polysaccharide deacetylase 2 family uncharacterized protein YibQ